MSSRSKLSLPPGTAARSQERLSGLFGNSSYTSLTTHEVSRGQKPDTTGWRAQDYVQFSENSRSMWPEIVLEILESGVREFPQHVQLLLATGRMCSIAAARANARGRTRQCNEFNGRGIEYFESAAALDVETTMAQGEYVLMLKKMNCYEAAELFHVRALMAYDEQEKDIPAYWFVSLGNTYMEWADTSEAIDDQLFCMTMARAVSGVGKRYFEKKNSGYWQLIETNNENLRQIELLTMRNYHYHDKEVLNMHIDTLMEHLRAGDETNPEIVVNIDEYLGPY